MFDGKAIPVQVIDCNNVFCSEVTCINELHALHESIVYSCREATRGNISHTTKSKQSRCVPVWTTEHSLAMDRSFFDIDYGYLMKNRNLDGSLI